MLSPSGLLTEPGTFAYAGDSVQARDNEFSRWIAGPTVDPIDLDAARNPEVRYERVIVFVADPRLGELKENDTTYSVEQLRRMVYDAACDSVTAFGRFDRTNNRSQAEVVLTPTLYCVNAWADTKMSKKEAQTAWGSAGNKIDGNSLSHINREAIDAYCGVILARANDGNEFASRRAVGRLIANQGQAVESGTFVVADSRGNGSTFADIQHAKLKSSELVRAIRAGIDGSVAEALVAVDRELWCDAASDGIRARRTFSESARTSVP